MIICFYTEKSMILLKNATILHFLPPIYYEEFKDLKTVEIASLVQTRIQQKLDELLV